MTRDPSPVAAFLNKAGPDGAGRSLDDVLAMADTEIEQRHDFIQWLFPLPEPSRAVPGSPVLTPKDQTAISASATALASLAAASTRMSGFYANTNNWLAPHDHNHLRITRIIRSLRLLVGDTADDRFRDDLLEQLESRGGQVNAQSLEHWGRA